MKHQYRNPIIITCYSTTLQSQTCSTKSSYTTNTTHRHSWPFVYIKYFNFLLPRCNHKIHYQTSSPFNSLCNLASIFQLHIKDDVSKIFFYKTYTHSYHIATLSSYRQLPIPSPRYTFAHLHYAECLLHIQSHSFHLQHTH